MAEQKQNLLIGRGERLIQEGVWPNNGRTKPNPYTIAQQRSVFLPVLNNLAQYAASQESQLAPRGEIAAKITIHPQFLAKSYFPTGLFRNTNLRLIGSRATEVAPRRMVRGKPVIEMPTAVLIVAGTERAFLRAVELLGDTNAPINVKEDFMHLERIEAFAAPDKKKGLDLANFDGRAEVVLHASFSDRDIVSNFISLAQTLGAVADPERARTVGGLTFFPLDIPVENAPACVRGLEEFTHLRAIRNMPVISDDPITESTRSLGKAFVMPTGAPSDNDIRAVIFDGGFTSGLLPWVNSFDAPGVPHIAPSLPHGQAVTSAFLFGAIDEHQSTISVPYCNVDHVRVLPSTATDVHVGDVIDRIMATLQAARDSGSPYSLANLSLGPRMPVIDDDPHEWTVRLDDFLSLGDLFMTVAVGNDGANGQDLGRIQPPSDAVNAFAVGASDGCSVNSKRASYSCLGPGRSPGLVKPDAVAFGGDVGSPLTLVNPVTGMTESHYGTSYSAPLALRLAAGLQSTIAQNIQPIMLHALLVSRSMFNSRKHDQTEVGWGILPSSVNELLFSPSDEVVVMYQGKISKGHPLRAAVPLPIGLSTDKKVQIAATFAYRAPLDPAHPVNYTRAGLEVRFQPDGISSTGFFSKTNFDTEQTLRSDALKWETCRHQQKSMDISALTDPSFVIRYQGRVEGGDDEPTLKDPVTSEPLPIELQPSALPFALVVRIKVPGVTDLAAHVLQQFSVLSEVPLRTQIQT